MVQKLIHGYIIEYKYNLRSGETFFVSTLKIINKSF
jgi:hypothetical protein